MYIFLWGKDLQQFIYIDPYTVDRPYMECRLCEYHTADDDSYAIFNTWEEIREHLHLHKRLDKKNGKKIVKSEYKKLIRYMLNFKNGRRKAIESEPKDYNTGAELLKQADWTSLTGIVTTGTTAAQVTQPPTNDNYY